MPFALFYADISKDVTEYLFVAKKWKDLFMFGQN